MRMSLIRWRFIRQLQLLAACCKCIQYIVPLWWLIVVKDDLIKIPLAVWRHTDPSAWITKFLAHIA